MFCRGGGEAVWSGRSSEPVCNLYLCSEVRTHQYVITGFLHIKSSVCLHAPQTTFLLNACVLGIVSSISSFHFVLSLSSLSQHFPYLQFRLVRLWKPGRKKIHFERIQLKNPKISLHAFAYSISFVNHISIVSNVTYLCVRSSVLKPLLWRETTGKS